MLATVWVSLFLTVSCIEAVLTALVFDNPPMFVEGNIIESDDAEVEFLLSTRDTIETPMISKIDDEGLLFNGTFNNSRKTKIFIHGWLDTWRKESSQIMLKAFLPEYDVNVIIVHWPEADDYYYPTPRAKVTPVGKITARFIERLVKEYDLNVTSLHVIGHSLGAHVAAVAGYNIENGFIGRISGLDPALPLFLVGGEDTLSTRAANFVEVVHTCGHVAGIFDAIGHVDFYPNGGVPFQPGCTLDLKCSHLRSFEYYAESIVNTTAFIGTECNDWSEYASNGCGGNQKLMMNGDTDPSARGKFYFKTAASSPYGLGNNS
uniref:Lipase 2 n=1 Tax=Lygus lineolaris TaxID=50650 RepID=A0A0U1XPH1_LYGLI|nr:lipase 2 [Lygus lineolaris]